MAEDLHIIQGTKEEQYQQLIPQIKGLLEGEPDLIANLGNICAALKEQFGWLWVGFYVVKPAIKTAEPELVLSTFRDRLPAHASVKAKVFAAAHGPKQEH